MFRLQKPDARVVEEFLTAQQQQSFSYPCVGSSREESPPPKGYDLDHNRILLGRGHAVYETACDVLRQWQMFPEDWTQIHPSDAPLEPGRDIALLVHACGVWWLNAARIVYVLDGCQPSRRFGFAYGTLPGHVERGEERFTIEWNERDEVWYDLLAFSRPRFWLARLGYPIARRLQRRFVRESQAAMRQLVTTRSPDF